MKFLKYLGILLAILVVLALVVGLFVDRNVKYEKSIVINAPIDSVWQNVNSLAVLDKWSPWNDYDPSMKKSMTGTDGTVGATSSWESDVDKVGKGSQTISKLEAPTLCETQLKFLTPYESEAEANVILTREGENTRATWVFKSVMPYPFNVSALFMNMDDMIGQDWNNGLNKLKSLSEGKDRAANN